MLCAVLVERSTYSAISFASYHVVGTLCRGQRRRHLCSGSDRSVIGIDLVAKSAPNGYTLMLTTNVLPVLPALYKSVPFSPESDLSHISRIATGSMALVVNPTVLPIKSLDELVTRARAAPGKLNYSSAGNGTPHHLGMELLKQQVGLDIVHIHYKGATGALNDLISGQVPLGRFR
jgi:tripartite-type tricarboxylate transporter receptor subunit TctC